MHTEGLHHVREFEFRAEAREFRPNDFEHTSCLRLTRSTLPKLQLLEAARIAGITGKWAPQRTRKANETWKLTSSSPWALARMANKVPSLHEFRGKVAAAE